MLSLSKFNELIISQSKNASSSVVQRNLTPGVDKGVNFSCLLVD